ncbi:MAG: hypothetical protein HPY76_05995 [Anaerolineae bacterium]|nr:hypothetical protein [Anaerolineae bacterium]
MSARIRYFREELARQPDKIQYLLENSQLPGPRANLELMQALVMAGDAQLLDRCLALDRGAAADGNHPEDFVVFCGIAGLGTIADPDQPEILAKLRSFASDHRWRIREGIAIALQAWGRKDYDAMFQCISAWLEGNPYELRAVVAALCEPDLLDDERSASQTIGILDRITAKYPQIYKDRINGWDVLEKGLSYGWSVAVVASPVLGKAKMDFWLTQADERIHRIMMANLKKKRLTVLDESWVNSHLNK